MILFFFPVSLFLHILSIDELTIGDRRNESFISLCFGFDLNYILISSNL